MNVLCIIKVFILASEIDYVQENIYIDIRNKVCVGCIYSSYLFIYLVNYVFMYVLIYMFTYSLMYLLIGVRIDCHRLFDGLVVPVVLFGIIETQMR